MGEGVGCAWGIFPSYYSNSITVEAHGLAMDRVMGLSEDLQFISRLTMGISKWPTTTSTTVDKVGVISCSSFIFIPSL